MSERPTPETELHLSALDRFCKNHGKLGEIADFARKLERERDEAREVAKNLKRERDEAREALRELLKLVPTASCEMFHHSKKDRHEFNQPCPLVERYNVKIKLAEEKAK